MPSQPITISEKKYLSEDDLALWQWLGTGQTKKLCDFYWEIENERTERAKQWRRGRYKD